MSWQRLLSILGLVGVVGLSAVPPAQAQHCTEECRSDQIQFTPGVRLTVEVVNQAGKPVYVQQMPMMAPQRLLPGASTTLGFGWGTTPNLSLRFWNDLDDPMRAYLFRPDTAKLRVELRSVPYHPSDRSLFVQNDGRVILQ